MPLPNTVVIGPGWAAHHRPTAAATMTSTCSLRKPGTTSGSFDDTTGTQGGTAHTPYLAGASCRVQALTEPGQVQLQGEQQITTGLYLVAVDWMTAGPLEPSVGDLVTVTDDDDPLLDGATLTIKTAVVGSLMWERDLVCILNAG